MKIVLNGEPFTGDNLSTVQSLIECKGLNGKRIAVMLNDSVIRKVHYSATELKENDRVEIVQMVGGG